jgi:hypothetical protein
LTIENNIVAQSGSITLTASSGALTVNSELTGHAGINTNIESEDGNLILNVASALPSSSIAIGAGVSLSASANGSPSLALGNVTVAIGALPAVMTNTGNPSPANIIVNATSGGTIFFGTKGIAAAACCDSLVSTGRIITFSTGALPASAITLGGADPSSSNNVVVTAQSAVLSPIARQVTVSTEVEMIIDTGDDADGNSQ